jgi:hypothetical protein
MGRLLIALTFLALVVPASVLAGGWATVGLGPPDDGIGPGDTWDARMTVLQHGNPETPLMGVSPTVTIRSGSASKAFRAVPTEEPGVYVARVVFPRAGTWSYEVHDGFTQYGGAQTHRFPAVTIGAGGGGGGFPTMTVTGVIVAGAGMLGLLWLLARRIRVRAAAPTH